MLKIKVGAACLNQTPLDWKGNTSRIFRAIDLARKQGVGLLCLPELCITGYGCEDFFHSPEVCEKAFQTLDLIVHQAPMDIAFCVGLPIIYGGAVYNVVAVAQNRRIRCLVAKQHLAGDGIHYEPRWFKPWPKNCVRSVNGILLGDVQVDFNGIQVGFEICEDAWVANRPGATLACKNVDIILNPSASHFALGKNEIRRRFIADASRAYKVTYVYANLLGNEAGRVIYDGDCIIAGGTDGTILKEGERFSFLDVVLTTAVIDPNLTRVARLSSASFSPSLDAVCAQGDSLNEHWEPLSSGASLKSWTEFEEFELSVSLGLWDYLRKSHSEGFVISLSGGADSAACAYLVHKAYLKAMQVHGADAVQKVLGAKAFSDVLTCVYQSTKNSSDQTFKAAAEVALDVQCNFIKLDVDDIVQAYFEKVSRALGRAVSWETDDVALQNIQARVRAPGAWFIANLENKLLITTSNRSEAAVGYCTMDGDTAGSIAPIAGVSKAFLLKWLQSESLQDAYVSANHITALKPTAELRPGSVQTDEDDLMPYEVLNAIETEAILNKRSPVLVYERILELFPQQDPDNVRVWVERFFRLWFRNQWKREKFTLSFQIDSRSLDPRTWCRTPILSAGYAEEIEALSSLDDNT